MKEAMLLIIDVSLYALLVQASLIIYASVKQWRELPKHDRIGPKGE